MWCEIDALQLADFTISKWAFHNIEEMRKKEATLKTKNENACKSYVITHHSITSELVLFFMLKQVVPCFLHITMALTKTLLCCLREKADDSAMLAQELAKWLESPAISIKLIPESKKKEKTITKRLFSKQLQKSRI